MRKWCRNCQWYDGRRYGYYCRLHRKHVSPYDTCEDFVKRKTQ